MIGRCDSGRVKRVCMCMSGKVAYRFVLYIFDIVICACRVAIFNGAGYAKTRIVPTLRKVGRREGECTNEYT